MSTTPLPKLSGWLIALAISTVIGLFSFARRHFDKLASDIDISPVPILVDEISAAWIAALLLMGVIALALRFPPWRYWWLFLMMAPAYAVTHTLGMFVTRKLLYPAFGLGTYQYGDLKYRFVMEAPVQLLAFAIAIAGVLIYERVKKARQAERLEGLLAEARLDQLRLSMAPHFLFNALNVISAAAYESAEKTDNLIAKLSRLLRAVLSADSRQICTLREELDLLNDYLDLQKARYENNLSIKIECPESLLEYQIPFMILQPLVENVFKHGMDANGQIDIRLTASKTMDTLILEVFDNGKGPGDNPAGIGTRNTRERIEHLYGPAYGYELEQSSSGGAIARLRLPCR